MSNPSLREQLAALSGQSGEDSSKNRPNPKKPMVVKQAAKAPLSAVKSAPPPWLERARYGVELLRAHFPSCFRENADIRPLKTGIRQDLVKQLGGRDDIALDDKACMVSSLAYYVNSLSYYRSAVDGADRIDLAGEVVGCVSAEEAAYAKQRLDAKQQKRQQGSRRPSKTVPSQHDKTIVKESIT